MDDRELAQRLTNIETLAGQTLETLVHIKNTLETKPKAEIKNTESKTSQKNFNITKKE